MLLCKDAALIRGEGDNFVAVPFDRPYFCYLSTDPVEEYEKTFKSKSGAKVVWFKATRPAAKLSVRGDSLSTLLEEASNYGADHYKTADVFEGLGTEIGPQAMLYYQSKGVALDLNADAQAGNRVAVMDPAEAEKKAIANIIADGKRRGKVFTEAQAGKIRAAQLALEAELG